MALAELACMAPEVPQSYLKEYPHFSRCEHAVIAWCCCRMSQMAREERARKPPGTRATGTGRTAQSPPKWGGGQRTTQHTSTVLTTCLPP